MWEMPRHPMCDVHPHWNAVQSIHMCTECVKESKKPRDLAVRDADGHALVGKYSARCDDLRMQLSGWHFSKELLSQGERDILYVAEQLMDELDRLAGGYLQ